MGVNEPHRNIIAMKERALNISEASTDFSGKRTVNAVDGHAFRKSHFEMKFIHHEL